MTTPAVAWFEVTGKDGAALQDFYGKLSIVRPAEIEHPFGENSRPRGPAMFEPPRDAIATRRMGVSHLHSDSDAAGNGTLPGDRDELGGRGMDTHLVRRQRRTGEREQFYSNVAGPLDNHLNARGNEEVARILFAALKKYRLLPQ